MLGPYRFSEFPWVAGGAANRLSGCQCIAGGAGPSGWSLFDNPQADSFDNFKCLTIGNYLITLDSVLEHVIIERSPVGLTAAGKHDFHPGN